MSEFYFKCRHCGASISADDSMIGTQYPCPSCGKMIVATQQSRQQAPLKQPVCEDKIKYCG